MTRLLAEVARVTVRSQPREATEAYPADRAAALAGVPRSTLHYWASHDIWKPSVSPRRVRLWSLSDIVMLRIIYWLRRGDKTGQSGTPIPRTTMSEVKDLLKEAVDLVGSHLFVDSSGRIVTETSSRLEHLNYQQLLRDNVIDVLAEYRLAEQEGFVGPDLTKPRPMLRIVPGKLAGEPHVVDTRLSTTLIDALLSRGYGASDVIAFYPFLTEETISQSRSLEDQLRGNVRKQAA